MPSMQSLRVLVAEDEPLTALVIEDLLAAEGHAVTLAGDGAVALAKATTQTFDVLVTDLAMPGVSGVELIRQVRLSQPHLPVVVMTGYLSPSEAQLLRGHARPPLALLYKPFPLESLLDALTRVEPPPARCALG